MRFFILLSQAVRRSPTHYPDRMILKRSFNLRKGKSKFRVLFVGASESKWCWLRCTPHLCLLAPGHVAGCVSESSTHPTIHSAACPDDPPWRNALAAMRPRRRSSSWWPWRLVLAAPAVRHGCFGSTVAAHPGGPSWCYALAALVALAAVPVTALAARPGGPAAHSSGPPPALKLVEKF